MNEIVNTFLLAGDQFISKTHLRQPGFTYSACEPFTKDKEIIQKFKETRDSRYISGPYFKYVGGGPEGFCGGHEMF